LNAVTPLDDRSKTARTGPGVDDLMGKPLKEAVRNLHVRLLRKALGEAKYNQQKAARSLGLTYHQFRGLYRKYQDDLSKTHDMEG
ncbi:MAG: hypothetical protein JRJ85_20100, partial [Deltaproteobacteria bacterium]|nr:hypothetical protein [Deltaproteobacteria bacterium]